MTILKIFSSILDFSIGQTLLYDNKSYKILKCHKEEQDNDHYSFTLTLAPLCDIIDDGELGV